jgi:hypothetical protein
MLARRPNRLAILVATVLFAIPAIFAPAVTRSVYAQPPAPHHKNWVQRHPTITAIGAGIVTHHMLKVAAARDKARGKRLNWAERHPTLSAIGVGVATHHIIKKTTPHD